MGTGWVVKEFCDCCHDTGWESYGFLWLKKRLCTKCHANPMSLLSPRPPPPCGQGSYPHSSAVVIGNHSFIQISSNVIPADKLSDGLKWAEPIEQPKKNAESVEQPKKNIRYLEI